MVLLGMDIQVAGAMLHKYMHCELYNITIYDALVFDGTLTRETHGFLGISYEL